MNLKSFSALIVLFCAIFSLKAAYQYNIQGNQGWLSFDGKTTVAFDLTRESQKNKDNGQDNYIDRGGDYKDYGWYNLDTGAHGSFKDGQAATFNENDRIGLWVKDNAGDVYASAKPEKNAPDNILWGKSRIFDDSFAVAGGNFGSNGTQEYYVFKVSTANTSNNPPTGQPLPGIIAVLALGGAALGVKKWQNNKKNKEK